MKLATPPFSADIKEQQLHGLLVGGQALAFETVAVSNAALVSLPIGNNTAWADKIVYCRIMLEVDATASITNKAVRFVQSPSIGGASVTGSLVTNNGFAFGDLGIITVNGPENMKNFRCIGVEAGKTHHLRVEYYG